MRTRTCLKIPLLLRYPNKVCKSQIWFLLMESSAQSLSRIRLCNPMNRSKPGLPVHHQLPEFTQTHVHQVGDAIQPSHPLSSPSPPAFNLSHISVFSNESVLRMRWPKFWSFSFSISPSNEYSGLIFFRMDWLDLLAVQGTLKSLLQHHSSKASILQHSASLSEKAMAPHASTLAWKIPWTQEPGRLQSMGSLRVGHDWATSLSLFTFVHWRRKWQPTPVFLPGESQGWGSLVGCRLWGRTELDTTEAT